MKSKISDVRIVEKLIELVKANPTLYDHNERKDPVIVAVMWDNIADALQIEELTGSCVLIYDK